MLDKGRQWQTHMLACQRWVPWPPGKMNVQQNTYRESSNQQESYLCKGLDKIWNSRGLSHLFLSFIFLHKWVKSLPLLQVRQGIWEVRNENRQLLISGTAPSKLRCWGEAGLATPVAQSYQSLQWDTLADLLPDLFPLPTYLDWQPACGAPEVMLCRSSKRKLLWQVTEYAGEPWGLPGYPIGGVGPSVSINRRMKQFYTNSAILTWS